MRCPGCGGPKSEKLYVCPSCWRQLPLRTKTALFRKDAKAAQRLHELYRQILDEVPLSEIQVAP